MNHTSDKPRKTHRNTASFSSTLLEEIYNSIDRKDHKSGDRKVFDEKPLRKQSNLSSSGSVSSSSSAAQPTVAGARRRMSLMSEFQDRDMFFFDSRKTKPRAIPSCFVADDHRKVVANNKTAAGQGQVQDHELLTTIKTKSTVYDKVYANLKKVKQPISPGGKLSSFISSLFSKKTKKNVEIKEEVVRDPMQRTVRFQNRPPVVVDHRDDLIIGKPTNRNIEETATVAKHVFDDDNDDDVDGFSDDSSDLFELDHKTVFGKSRFCDELPVYEKTSYFVKNNRLIS